MEKHVHMGLNKTGIQMAPLLTKDMVSFAEKSAITESSSQTFEDIRREYNQATMSVGTVPLPGTVKGAASVGMQKLTGKNPELLIDKLGERLAFERTGTRLYEALLLKCEESPLNLPLERLRQIRNEEHSHFQLLREVMQELGADPTAQTPCADVAAVASMGLIQVVGDPRTNIPQALNAILVAELTDNAAWELLIELAEKAGIKQFTPKFEQALASEKEHLATIHELLSRLTLEELKD